jgi:hypothetical protein
MITCVCFKMVTLGYVIRCSLGTKWRVTGVDFSAWGRPRLDILSGEVTIRQEECQVFNQDPFRILAWNCNQELGPIGIWDWEERHFLPEFNHTDARIFTRG